MRLDVNMKCTKTHQHGFSRIIISRPDEKLFRIKHGKKVYETFCDYRDAHPELEYKVVCNFRPDKDSCRYDTHTIVYYSLPKDGDNLEQVTKFVITHPRCVIR